MMKWDWGQIYRMLRWVALAMLVLLFWQVVPFDLLAVAFAGDMLAYLEIAAVVLLAAQVTRLRWAAAYTRFMVQRTVRRARVRARRVVRRMARLRPQSGDDDRPTPAFAFA